MPRPGIAPSIYEKKKTLEEYKVLYPDETTSLLDLYHAYHRWIKNNQKKVEIRLKNKSKSKTDTDNTDTN
jgi:hypothetical protein